jgi:hypothetical protein
MRVSLPPLPEQRAIAHILGALDDKIELNRRMARTLEEIARAIFKSWFVDFDPVRAKAEGRRPLVPPELEELFPSKLVDSPIGPVPAGWEVTPLGEHVEVVRGLSYRGADLVLTHIGFGDESYWNEGRFRALGLVTTSMDRCSHLEAGLRALLEGSRVSEFKWSDLRGAKERLAAEEMCRFAIDHATKKELRIDVLIWDVEDRRHKIKGRDDVANLQRMYYHLFRNVLRMRWADNAVWRLHPDEHTALDWETVRDCLDAVSVRPQNEQPTLATDGTFRLRLRREFGIEEIQPLPSQESALLQLADLFAGLAVFSRSEYDAYQAWLRRTSAQPTLDGVGTADDPEPSRASQQRFLVLRALDQGCKDRRLGVSLATWRGLRTPNPANPINFWLYEPQHEFDIAPTGSSS